MMSSVSLGLELNRLEKDEENRGISPIFNSKFNYIDIFGHIQPARHSDHECYGS